jgi:hypothetical protein
MPCQWPVQARCLRKYAQHIIFSAHMACSVARTLHALSQGWHLLQAVWLQISCRLTAGCVLTMPCAWMSCSSALLLATPHALCWHFLQSVRLGMWFTVSQASTSYRLYSTGCCVLVVPVHGSLRLRQRLLVQFGGIFLQLSAVRWHALQTVAEIEHEQLQAWRGNQSVVLTCPATSCTRCTGL